MCAFFFFFWGGGGGCLVEALSGYSGAVHCFAREEQAATNTALWACRTSRLLRTGDLLQSELQGPDAANFGTDRGMAATAKGKQRDFDAIGSKRLVPEHPPHASCLHKPCQAPCCRYAARASSNQGFQGSLRCETTLRQLPFLSW